MFIYRDITSTTLILVVCWLQMPIVVTHTMNVFGERQNPEKFIPGVLSAVMNGQQVGARILELATGLREISQIA